MIRNHFQRISKSKPYKIIRRIFWILFLLWWLLLGHITPSAPPEIEAEDACFIDNYRVDVQPPWPINPMGLWLTLRYIKDQPYYIVVYDDKGHYIGQSSPTLHNDDYGKATLKRVNVCNFIDIKNDKIIVPGHNVSVPLHHKKWWSWILQWVHN